MTFRLMSLHKAFRIKPVWLVDNNSSCSFDDKTFSLKTQVSCKVRCRTISHVTEFFLKMFSAEYILS